MDPLSALSIASSIVQLIDFGCKVVRQTKEVSQVRSTVTVQHLSDVTSDLTKITSSLQQQFIQNRKAAALITDEEQGILNLAVKCDTVANELMACIEKIKIKAMKAKGESKTKRETWLWQWQSFRNALKTIWSKEYIDELAQNLSAYREQLSLHLLLLLNKHARLRDEKLHLAHQTSQDIVNIISIQLNSLQLKLDERDHVQGSLRSEGLRDMEKRHAEIITAILTTRDGQSRTIKGSPASDDLFAQATQPEIPQTVTTYQREGDSEQHNSPIPNFASTNGGAETNVGCISKQILEALYFREMSDRRSRICGPQARTFEWVFREPHQGGKKWDDFSNWLRTGRGCYWVNGKAGSGKSTLMKYIQGDARTTNALRGWAGSGHLIVESFFFWYAGTPLQRSQIGLLRSLLLAVLAQRPSLAPILFPDVFRAILSGQIQGYCDLSIVELKKAFSTLMELKMEDLKVCFVVDGIDEYEGDHAELADMFATATKSNAVKILLSSRPIPSCVYSFSGFPSLRLQDLTHDDICQFSREVLSLHPLMQKVESFHPGTTTRLVQDITSKASGVFLWVVLVIKVLFQGLQDYDTVVELQHRLDDLPDDLEKLYSHMLGSMNPRHRREGSKLLQLALRSYETHEDYPMTLLQLSYAEEEDDYMKSVSTKITILSDQEESWRCESTEGRLRSRCCGLIEVEDTPSVQEGKAGHHIGFFHRTVVEFLKLDTVWRELISWTNGAGSFEIDQALLSSSLYEMKVKRPKDNGDQGNSMAFRSLLRIFSYDYSMMENGPVAWADTYFKPAKDTMESYWLSQGGDSFDRDELSPMDAWLVLAMLNCSESHFQTLLAAYKRCYNITDDDLVESRVSYYLLTHLS